MNLFLASYRLLKRSCMLPVLFCFLFFSPEWLFAQGGKSAGLLVRRTADFEVTGTGSASEWNNATWLELAARKQAGKSKSTRMKTLYSSTGMYFLFHCEDSRLTATMNADFMDLWTEDVVEVFLWPDQHAPFYFEYEISPLNYELPILISNVKGELLGWQPFHYGGDRKTRHATGVAGGTRQPGAVVSGWTAEFFIPYKLLSPLQNHIPSRGTRWKGNFYRIDYDPGEEASWSWQATRINFHDYERFGEIIFE